MRKIHLALNTTSQSKIEGEILKIITEKFRSCPEIILEICAVEGYVSIQGSIENKRNHFVLQLPKLYEQSKNNRNGSSFFEQKCVAAINEIRFFFFYGFESLTSLFLRTELKGELKKITS